MRRPTSDVRQRESRRSSLDNNGSRRRNSSVPYHNTRLERNPNSLDSDTDFLCDRTVEFMESGDIHSIVAVELAEQSMYFERLLRYHKGRGYIRLPEFLNSGFLSVLEFIRKGKTDINPENVYNIFIAADYLLVPKLKQECANLLKNIANDSSTAILLWLNCRSFYWPEIGLMAFEKILENFDNIWLTNDFQQLESYDVWKILREDNLNCRSEKTVFDAIHKWINFSPKTRLKYALDLLLCIRIGMLNLDELNFMKNHELCKSIPDYLNLLQEWPNCLTQLNNPFILACGKLFITPRLPHEVVMVFGGWCDGEGPRAAAQVYNPRSNTWTLWTDNGPQSQSPAFDWFEQLKTSPNLNKFMEQNNSPIHDEGSTDAPTNPQQNALDVVAFLTAFRNSLPPDGVSTDKEEDSANLNIMDNCGNLIGEIPRRVYAGCVLVGTRVYLVGGFDGTNALKSTLCYDFEIDSGWYEISCMYEKRYYVSVAYANDHIYALGGHNGENQGRLDTAERYTLQENLWQTIASMNRVRSDAAAAELGGRVYVAGGFEGRRYHDSAEYYEPDTNQWTLVSRMHSPRGGISLTQHGGYLYAIGGNDGNSRLRSIERYDPNEGKWELVGQMNRRKSNLSSTVMNDEIYILGGWSDEPEAGILDLVEVYNTVTHECRTVRSLTFPASATCACTLKNKNLVRKYIRPLPINSSNTTGPEFAAFMSQINESTNSPSNLNQSTASVSPSHESTYVTPTITGQRNTNNQLQTNLNCNVMLTNFDLLQNENYPLNYETKTDLNYQMKSDECGEQQSEIIDVEQIECPDQVNDEQEQHFVDENDEEVELTNLDNLTRPNSKMKIRLNTNSQTTSSQRLRSPWRSGQKIIRRKTRE